MCWDSNPIFPLQLVRNYRKNFLRHRGPLERNTCTVPVFLPAHFVYFQGGREAAA